MAGEIGMAMNQALPEADAAPPVDLRNFGWMALAFALLAAIIWLDNRWLLNFVHVMCGVLWTGIDLFMGFVVGPLLRSAPFPARRAFVIRLTPKTLFLMPTLSILTTTAGYFHAKQLGFLSAPYPAYYWVLGALAVVTILTIQGLGYLLPTNLKVYWELKKPQPDGARVGMLMKNYFKVVAIQGVMQVAIIVIMARFVTGL
ncbi:MAG: hypothetical protein KGO53_07035 [Alphaproteobacteria bacterium]|nr:hypothetical protein [Alphaproteobacteria bacterium]